MSTQTLPGRIKSDLLELINATSKEYIKLLSLEGIELKDIKKLNELELIYTPVLHETDEFKLRSHLTHSQAESYTYIAQNDSDKNIPNILLLGSQFGEKYKDYYLMKLPKEDVRAAFLGRLTSCCQTLGDKDGSGCVKYGLSSKLSGFYVNGSPSLSSGVPPGRNRINSVSIAYGDTRLTPSLSFINFLLPACIGNSFRIRDPVTYYSLLIIIFRLLFTRFALQ